MGGDVSSFSQARKSRVEDKRDTTISKIQEDAIVVYTERGPTLLSTSLWPYL